MTTKPKIELCETGKILNMIWAKLLDQRKPKASSMEKSSAKSAYINHRRLCEK